MVGFQTEQNFMRPFLLNPALTLPAKELAEEVSDQW